MHRLYIRLLLPLLVLSLATEAQTITTVAGTGVFGNGANGSPATACAIEFPGGVATDHKGNLYFASRSLVRRVDSTGTVTTIAGGGTGTTDSIAATTASITNAANIFVDSHGTLYIADRGARKVRRVDTTGLIYTLAGGGLNNTEGIPATSFSLFNVNGVVADGAGNVYLSDAGLHRVLRVDTAGVIHFFAGFGVAGWTADGMATGSALNTPFGLAIDAAGNVYIADSYNQRIRRVDATDGMMHTVAGSGYTGYTGDGSSALDASMDTPQCVAVLAGGSLCIGDSRGDRIRVVDGATGNISTLAGNSSPGYGGDGGPATAAMLHGVTQMALTPGSSLLLSDYNNFRIRSISSPLRATDIHAASGQILCFPDPATDQLILRWTEPRNGTAVVRVLSVMGREMAQLTLQAGQDHVLNLNGWPAGSYWVVLTDGGMPVASTQFVKLR
jgi:sugar lactone lactonase YvrE